MIKQEIYRALDMAWWGAVIGGTYPIINYLMGTPVTDRQALIVWVTMGVGLYAIDKHTGGGVRELIDRFYDLILIDSQNTP